MSMITLLGTIASQDKVSVYSGKTVMFALMGQSNMIGRYGPITSPADDTNASILMYSSALSINVTAQDPLDHFDETANTVGPGLTFAKDFLSNQSPTRVILVGMAEGGTGFLAGDWLPNRAGLTYENARTRWEAAYAEAVSDYGAPNVVVGGALWIQGEDEIQNYTSQFSTSTTGREHYISMPSTMFNQVRSDFSGFTSDTPVVFGSVPSGAGLTSAGTAYTEIQAGIADIANRLDYAGFADGTDLSEGDGVHYDAASCRTLGSRMYTAFVSAMTATSGISSPPTFTEDASNVETAFAFDFTGVGDGSPLIMQAGTYPLFENKRVYVESGAMVFDGTSELRWGDGRQARPLLSDRDWVFKCTFNPSNVSAGGIWGAYDSAGSQRSFAIRFSSGTLSFLGSSDGATPVNMLSASFSTSTEYDLEIRRVGTDLEMFVDGVSEDTYTLSGGYTFFNTLSKVQIGDYQNNVEFEGTIKSISFEYLS